MEMDDIARGWAVFSEDGKRIGDVVEVHPHYLLVSRGLLVVRDVYVPRYAVAAVEERKVHLAISDERLRRMGWNAPPPPPPLAPDSATPQLVPNYEEPGPPPLEFGGYEEPDPFAGAGTEGAEVDSSAYADLWQGDDSFAAPVYDDYEDMGIMFGAAVEVDGEAYLQVRRVGDGPAVVFIHGWGFDARVWDYLLLDLPSDYTVVTYQARGYGGSSAPWTGYDLDGATRDLRVLLRTLELEDATLVGLDSGAAVALHYAVSGGRRAGRLVLIAPIATATDDFTLELPEPLRAWWDEIGQDRPRLAAQLAELWAPDASPETRAWLRDGLLAAAPHALRHGLTTLAQAEAGDPGEVTLPTLILHGEADPVAPIAHSRGLAAAIPQARLVVLETPGHLPMLADPARIAAEIRAMIPGNTAEEPESAEAPNVVEEFDDTAGDVDDDTARAAAFDDSGHEAHDSASGAEALQAGAGDAMAERALWEQEQEQERPTE